MSNLEKIDELISGMDIPGDVRYPLSIITKRCKAPFYQELILTPLQARLILLFDKRLLKDFYQRVVFRQHRTIQGARLA